MPAIIVPRRQLVQPQGRVEIDPRHWLADYIDWAMVGRSAFDAARGTAITESGGTVPQIATLVGVAAGFTAALRRLDGAPVDYADGHTLLAVAVVNSTAAAGTIVGWSNSADVNNYLQFGMNAGGTIRAASRNTGYQGSNSTGAATAGVPFVAGGVWASNASRIAYFNGAGGTANTVSVSVTGTAFCVGAVNRSGAAYTDPLNGNVAALIRIRRALSALEMREFSRPEQVWQLFRRDPVRLYFDVGSGNSGDYEATDSPDVFEADGDLIIEGDYAATDEPDTFAADGDLVIQGDYAATDEPDVFEASSSETIEGDYAATDSPDVFAADGDLLIEGDYAATDSPDVFFATNIAASRTQTIIRYVYRPYENVTDRRYVDQLNQDLRTIYGQISGLSRGVVAAHDSRDAAPTGGTWQQGDFVRNFSPTELGSSSSKYVILGWSCVASGTPGTWLECRCLTGN